MLHCCSQTLSVFLVSISLLVIGFNVSRYPTVSILWSARICACLLSTCNCLTIPCSLRFVKVHYYSLSNLRCYDSHYLGARWCYLLSSHRAIISNTHFSGYLHYWWKDFRIHWLWTCLSSMLVSFSKIAWFSPFVKLFSDILLLHQPSFSFVCIPLYVSLIPSSPPHPWCI